MAVYEHEEIAAVISRINAKVARKKIQLGEVLSDKEILAFEERSKIKLPECYRLFLSQVGDGCKMLGFTLKKLNGVRVNDNMRRPFKLTEAYIWEDENVSDQELFDKVLGGRLELVNLGDGMSFELILNGKCRGEVWSFVGVGAQPCCKRQDFLGWFEKWLDDGDLVDYFEDYIV